MIFTCPVDIYNESDRFVKWSHNQGVQQNLNFQFKVFSEFASLAMLIFQFKVNNMNKTKNVRNSSKFDWQFYKAMFKIQQKSNFLRFIKQFAVFSQFSRFQGLRFITIQNLQSSKTL